MISAVAGVVLLASTRGADLLQIDQLISTLDDVNDGDVTVVWDSMVIGSSWSTTVWVCTAGRSLGVRNVTVIAGDKCYWAVKSGEHWRPFKWWLLLTIRDHNWIMKIKTCNEWILDLGLILKVRNDAQAETISRIIFPITINSRPALFVINNPRIYWISTRLLFSKFDFPLTIVIFYAMPNELVTFLLLDLQGNIQSLRHS